MWNLFQYCQRGLITFGSAFRRDPWSILSTAQGLTGYLDSCPWSRVSRSANETQACWQEMVLFQEPISLTQYSLFIQSERASSEIYTWIQWIWTWIWEEWIPLCMKIVKIARPGDLPFSKWRRRNKNTLIVYGWFLPSAPVVHQTWRAQRHGRETLCWEGTIKGGPWGPAHHSRHSPCRTTMEDPVGNQDGGGSQRKTSQLKTKKGD